MAHRRASRRVGRYRSPLEAAVGGDLDARGVPFQYEEHELYYELPKVYVPDFTLPNGIHVEVKGYFPIEDRSKMLEVRRSNPDVDIRIVFGDSGKKISKRPGSMTYGQWATRMGFQWADAYVPRAWVEESGNEDQ